MASRVAECVYVVYKYAAGRKAPTQCIEKNTKSTLGSQRAFTSFIMYRIEINTWAGDGTRLVLGCGGGGVALVPLFPPPPPLSLSLALVSTLPGRARAHTWPLGAAGAESPEGAISRTRETSRVVGPAREAELSLSTSLPPSLSPSLPLSLSLLALTLGGRASNWKEEVR
jgi:hypothetical protein